jgi:hypothetical protein
VIGLVSLALPSLRELDRLAELTVDPKP